MIHRASAQRLVALLLELEVREDRNQVGIAASFSDSVDRSLDMIAPSVDRREGVGSREVTIVMAVDTELGLGACELGLGMGDDRRNLFRERSAIGVAQNNPLRAGLGRCLNRGQCVSCVGFVAIKEMFSVINNRGMLGKKCDALTDHVEVFLQGDAQDFGGVEVPRLTDQRDDRSLGRHQRSQSRVVGRFDTPPAGHTKGSESAGAEVQFFRLLEKESVLFVGQGIPPFDHVDSDFSQTGSDVQFILERQTDPFPLCAITQRGVVDQNRSGWHRRTFIFKNKATSGTKRAPEVGMVVFLKRKALSTSGATIEFCYAMRFGDPDIVTVGTQIENRFMKSHLCTIVANAFVWGSVLLIGATRILGQDALERLKPEYLKQMREARESFALQRQPPDSDGSISVRANLHVHSELSHDSRGKIEDIVAAAKRAGTEVLMFTEHPSQEKDFFLDGNQGVRDGVLLIPGAEMKGMLVFPTMSLRPYESSEPIDLARLVRTRGGHVFLSHLEERMDWEIPGLSGVEIYNTHADFKKQKRMVEAMKNPLWLVKLGELVKEYPQEVFSALQSYPDDYLKRWDELNQIAPHCGVAANDAHQNVGVRIRLKDADSVSVEDPIGDVLLTLPKLLAAPVIKIPTEAMPGDLLFSLQLDPYECSLRHAGTHLIVNELSREGVWDALENGRAFVAFDWLADAKGFHAHVLDASNGETFPLGSHVVFGKELSWVAEAPLGCRWRLIRDGVCVAEKEGSKFQEPLAESGIYRIEAWLTVGDETYPWILSNPIFVERGDDGG